MSERVNCHSSSSSVCKYSNRNCSSIHKRQTSSAKHLLSCIRGVRAGPKISVEGMKILTEITNFIPVLV